MAASSARAQIVQAAAARIAPEARMNPVLIKPEADTRSQVVVLGEVDHELSRCPGASAAHVSGRRARVAARLDGRLRRGRDRGRGQPGRDQPARRRHREHGMALEVAAPVLLCCDIDRGGAFAHLLGTGSACARGARRSRAASCSTASAATRRCSRRGPSGSRSAPACRCSGSFPWIDVPLPEEDGVALQGAAGDGQIAIVALPRIANLDEFAPLGAAARFVRARPRSTGLRRS